MSSIKAWQVQATSRFAEVGLLSPQTDARELLKFVLRLDDTALFLSSDREVSETQAAQLLALIDARAARIPLQHLLDEVEWGGVRLKSDGRALIPRPETEWLLHLALEALHGTVNPRVLDVGTGTGALALGIKFARSDAAVTATDISTEALALAQENATLNGLDVQFVQADLFRGISGSFDLIVSNPPYLPDTDQHSADPEVRHDPDLALYAGADGLSVARPLLAQVRAVLAQAGSTVGGVLLLELDPRNAPTLAAEARTLGAEAEVLPDLAGRERFVRVSWPTPALRT
ncbi:peptide chain release factor N(5)-glutamine methyltransferase [Deinococcus sp. Arct2-2]|uniref:peptide chain release factor N(5)-glutamine methyltransferase n=1 Tax=Deinococcus sp. Arct2-2 TaxID=2568653 RepID=UPI0010A4C256|nr:peptide chain release factor N(5)-glutamine methyltransferase [Deinococcus sp. Arct2-2]THF70684.1 peptide chain release factor N(5)-glutamine methyltransferase [Deinococcus sp. Arct2-2]